MSDRPWERWVQRPVPVPQPRLFQPILAWDVAAVRRLIADDQSTLAEVDADGLNAFGLAASLGLTDVLQALSDAATDAAPLVAPFRCARLPAKPLVTPLMAGCWLGHSGVVDVLLNDPRVDASQVVPGQGPRSLLDVALVIGDRPTLRRLCREPAAAAAAWARAFVTGAHVAPIVVALFVVELDADPNAIVDAAQAETALMRACTNYDVLAVNSLLAFKADVAQRDVLGRDACARLLRYLSGHGREATVGVPTESVQLQLVERLFVAGASLACPTDVTEDVARMAQSARNGLKRRLAYSKRRR